MKYSSQLLVYYRLVHIDRIIVILENQNRDKNLFLKINIDWKAKLRKIKNKHYPKQKYTG